LAGKLIESVGLKGTRIGNAQISEKHANFIVNLGNARADDVHALVKLAQKEVKSKYCIDLIPELRIIGEFKSPNHF
jgi:UDP-N-acetylmuramate dehydrogenase